MSVRSGIERILRLVTPPIIPKAVAYLRISGAKDYILEYAPQAHASQIVSGIEPTDGWNAENVAGTERGKWEAFCRNLEGTGPLGFAHEHPDLSVTRFVPFHNVHITYAYVLALTALGKDATPGLASGG